MPELPEVEAIRGWLDARVYGRGLAGAALESIDARDLDAPALELPARVLGVARWGKELALLLDGQPALAIHLRMTGDLVAGEDPRARLVLRTSRGPVSLVDARKLARVRLAEPGPGPPRGPDVLDDPPSAAELRARLDSRRPVKAALLDQGVVSGLGNIWVDEVLFAARVHPATPAREADADALARALREVVPRATRALERGWTDEAHGIEWIRHSDDEDALPSKVHRRAGLPCPACGALIEKTRVAGRGTYLCPRCQPRPRSLTGPG